MFDALDGKSNVVQVNGTQARETNINYRDEPVAFFFVLFGIAIEALVTRSNNDSPNAEAQIRGILSALKKILRPSVSGNAIFQDVVFSETIEVFDRLALTEGLDVQLIIVDIVRNLCLTHPSATEEDAAGDHLSDDIEQLFELTRIIVLVLARVLPNLAEQTSAAINLPDDAIPLIQISLGALVDASEIFPSIIKIDLHASILHIFASILGTGTCQTIVVPQALPIFRRFIQSIVPIAEPLSETITDQLRGCLHRFLSILSHAQRRETDISLLCAKNTLLACTILISTASRAFSPSDPLLTTLQDSMLDCLQDLGLAKVAASCLRSLLLISPKTPTDEAIARYLFPRLAHFTLDTSIPDPENARSLTAHTLTSFVTTLPSSSTPAAMSTVIPILLSRASSLSSTSENPPIFKETATRLLELASADPAAFRGVVTLMSEEQRSFMEGVIRDGGAASGRRRGEERDEGPGGAEPSIALKLSFGG